MLMDLVPIMVPILPQEGLVSFGDQEINSVLNSISRQQFARKFTHLCSLFWSVMSVKNYVDHKPTREQKLWLVEIRSCSCTKFIHIIRTSSVLF